MSDAQRKRRCIYCQEIVSEEEIQQHTAECRAVGLVVGLHDDISDDDEIADHPDAAVFGNPLFS